MAVSKKSVTVASAKETSAAAPVEETKAVTPTPPVKTETVKETVKKEEPAKKETIKKEATKKAPAKKATTQKTVAEKKEPAKRGRVAKADLKSEVYVQFSGKSYSQDDLIKIAKDVWKYDLKQKASGLNSIALYVKPEENAVYYVMNKEFTGKFDI